LRRPPTQAIPRPEAQQNLAEKRIALDVSGAINAANRGVRRFFVLGVETVRGFATLSLPLNSQIRGVRIPNLECVAERDRRRCGSYSASGSISD
jgi:hypothetical protein